MEVRGDTLTDKENAGAALLDACKEVKGPDPVQIGSYRGFAMFASFDAFQKEYTLQPFALGNRRLWTGLPPAVHIKLHIQFYQTGVFHAQFFLIGEGFSHFLLCGGLLLVEVIQLDFYTV